MNFIITHPYFIVILINLLTQLDGIRITYVKKVVNYYKSHYSYHMRHGTGHCKQ